MPAHSAPAAKDGWHAVDQVLADLDRLAASDLAEDAFYEALFERLVTLGCTAAAFWQIGRNESPQLVWQAPPQQSQNGHNPASEANRAAVAAALSGTAPQLIEAATGSGVDCEVRHPHGKPSPQSTEGPFHSPPSGTVATSHNGSSGLSILVPFTRSVSGRGVLQVWLPAAVRAAATEGYLRLFAAVGEVLTAYFSRQEQDRLRGELEQQSRIDAFNQSLHESLDLDQTAFRIVNDGRVLIACDRLAVAIRRGCRHKVVAVSGAEHVHRRSESIHQLERLIDRVVASGQPLWVGGQPQDLPPEISQPLADYLDHSPAIALAVIPLVAPTSEKGPAEPPRSVLIFEQYSQPFDRIAQGAIDAILPHCRLALTNSLRLRSIPAHRFWLAVGREGWLPTWASRSALALIALAAIIAALVLIPADVWIKTRGELQPASRNEVFAPRDGVVTAVHIDHGQHVSAGDKLLDMRSPELDLELQRVQGELETTRKRLAAAQSERLQIKPSDADARLRQRRLSADEEQLQQQVAALELRDNMLQQQLADLTVKSPVSGDCITWNVQQQLAARPLRRGDALLTIADINGPWQLELRVPSRRAGRLLAARGPATSPQDVSFMLATDPGRALSGTVKHIAERVETDDSGESYLLVTVEIQRDLIPRRVPGATALAKIRCSRSSLGESLFHDLFDAARLWLPF